MKKRYFPISLCLIALLSIGMTASAQNTGTPPAKPAVAVKTVEITPSKLEAEVGQQIKFSAVGKDESGLPTDLKPIVWVAAPFDLASADESGMVTIYGPGEVIVLTVIGGKSGFVTIKVKPPHFARVDVEPLTDPIFVGGTAQMKATARYANGDPRRDAIISWTSETPSVATVDAAGLVVGVAPGEARLKAQAENAVGTVTFKVVKNNVNALTVQPRSTRARTGDVVKFTAQGSGMNGAVPVRWAVSGEGATIESDGGFVADEPGTYVITAACGDRVAVSSIVVTPRNVEREIKVISHTLIKDQQTAEQWIFGKYAYIATIADKVFVYDISDPAAPTLTDTVKVDARIINDISTTPDGKIGVLTREGASSRKNGIVFLDTSDMAHPKVVSEYTATVTGGVHSAFIDSHYVYLTDDATGSLRVIDFQNVKEPKEVARWQVENPMARTVNMMGNQFSAGRYLHDVQVKDGLAYLAYWRDGIVVLDVGKGIKGGSPEKPQFVSQLRFNYHELYGPGWLAGAHAVFRDKNYLFVGDEVFPAEFNLGDKSRIPVRGVMHVVDVTDIEHPRKVAEYAVPESGSHNIWVKDNLLYMGYYNGGGRVLDISGELRGDLYRQGREVARLWTGDKEGFRPNLPFAWGAQPQGDLVYFNDINSGLWIVKLGEPKEKGSTTTPGY
jgi:uncharacterized protein YjdB